MIALAHVPASQTSLLVQSAIPVRLDILVVPSVINVLQATLGSPIAKVSEIFGHV